MIRRPSLILLFSSALLLAACSNSTPSALVLKTSTPTTPPPPPHYNALSGRIGPDGQVLAVKVDDTGPAHPQIGLEDADVVYVEQVEGGLTRLAAIFSSTIPAQIGPVRSARISDIDLLAQYGKVAFAYSGAQAKMRPVIAAANLVNLSAGAQPASIFARDSTRSAPVNLLLNAPKLMPKAPDAVTAHNVGWTFGPAPLGGVPIIGVSVRWPDSHYQATWSQAEGRWLLAHDKTPDLASSGVHLGPTTLVIQQVLMHPSPYGDKFGSNTPMSETVGDGTGWILRDGKAYQTTWSRTSAESGTLWRLADGSEMPFAAGSIWVFLSDKSKAPVFQTPVPEPSATPSASVTK